MTDSNFTDGDKPVQVDQPSEENIEYSSKSAAELRAEISRLRIRKKQLESSVRLFEENEKRYQRDIAHLQTRIHVGQDLSIRDLQIDALGRGELSHLPNTSNRRPLLWIPLTDLQETGRTAVNKEYSLTGTAPKLLMQIPDAQIIEPGDYILELENTGPIECFSLADICINSGNGFNPDEISPVSFYNSGLGALRSLIHLPFGATQLRLDFSTKLLNVNSMHIGSIRILKLDHKEYTGEYLENYTSTKLSKFVSRLKLFAKRKMQSCNEATVYIRDKLHQHMHELQEIEAARRRIACPDTLEGEGLSYATWINEVETPSSQYQSRIISLQNSLNPKPTVLVFVQVDSRTEAFALDTIQSLICQTYDKVRIHAIIQNGVTSSSISEIEELSVAHPNLTMSQLDIEASFVDRNEIIRQSKAQWVGFINAGGIADPIAVSVFMIRSNRTDGVALLFCDEDQLNKQNQRANPIFKTSLDQRLLTAQNCIGNLSLYSSETLNSDEGLELQSVPFDNHKLASNFAELRSSVHAVHIPHILFHSHWSNFSVAALEPSQQLTNKYASHGLQTKISIILPTKDQPELLSKCLKSIFRRTTYRNFEVVIIDNQTTDKRALRTLRRYSSRGNVKVVKFDKPFNYSAINNLAVSEATGDVICLLNNDIEIITPDWLEMMLSELELDKVGAVGPKLLYDDDTVQHAGIAYDASSGFISRHVLTGLHSEAPGYLGLNNVTRQVSAITGACLLMRKELYTKLGGLDDINLPVSYNDIDLCFKITQAGFRIIWTPNAKLYHYESKTRGKDDSPAKREQRKQEIEHMQRKWQKTISLNDPYFPPALDLETGAYTLSSKSTSALWENTLGIDGESLE